MATDLTKMVERLDKVSMDEGSARNQLLLAMAERIKHLEKRIKDAEDRHRRLLQG